VHDCRRPARRARGILLAARMDVTWMERHGSGDDASVKQRLARLRNVLDQGIELKRRVVEELRPTLLDTMACWPHCAGRVRKPASVRTSGARKDIRKWSHG